MSGILILFPLCLSSFLFAQKAEINVRTEGVQLATVTARPDHYHLRRGEDLGVTLTIKAGARGAYLPNFFADWDQTCQSGFSVDIYTRRGDRASTSVRGCVGESLGPGPPAQYLLLTEYVLLKPGESRSWHTTLTNIRRSPGTYEIKAEYLSAQTRIGEVAVLPEVQGLMVVGHVPAKPVFIQIH